MALIVLATFSIPGCGFLLYVLVQWMRDKGPKPARRSPIVKGTVHPGEKNQPRAIRSSRTTEKGDQFTLTSDRVKRPTNRKNGRRPAWNHVERLAYERIARSFSLVKKG